jgi:hypothetical protein
LQSQLSKQASKTLTLKFNPIWIIGIITLIAGLTAIDNFRFNGSIQKPDHRYFVDPNYYLDVPK